MTRAIDKDSTYVALQSADQELLQGLTGLVAVADVLKGLGGILTSHVEQNLLTTAVQEYVSMCAGLNGSGDKEADNFSRAVGTPMRGNTESEVPRNFISGEGTKKSGNARGVFGTLNLGH